MRSQIRRNGVAERSGIVMGRRAFCLVPMFPVAWAAIGNRSLSTSIPGFESLGQPNQIRSFSELKRYRRNPKP